MNDSLFNRALLFAMEAHDGVFRKSSGVPFIIHPMEVACIVATLTENEEVLAAALLHDTIEDTEVSIEDIRERFGEEVALLVASETEDKRRDMLPEDSWQIRKEESLEVLKNTTNINIKILWLADKLANLRSFARLYEKKKDRMWEDFHQRDHAKQAWYYFAVQEYTSELTGTPAHLEYSILVDKVFGGLKYGTLED